MKSRFWAKVAYFIIILFIVLTAFTLVMLPFLVKKYAEVTGTQIQNVQLLIAFLYATALPFAVLLIKAKVLCKNILRNNPFCESSISALNIICICSFIDSLLYAIGTIVILKNLLSFTIMIAAFMIGLVCLILAQLARTAMEIKHENDLTI